MTPEAQRIAIAEACGAKYHKPTEAEIKSGSYYQYEPDYTRDLNSMHEAEKVLTLDQKWTFAVELRNMVQAEQWKMLHATASQRAEAFLRTLGKWDDSK